MEIANNKNQENKIKLSIQISLNGLSFCGLDRKNNKILYFRQVSFPGKLNPLEVLEQIEKVYEQEEFLRKQPQEVAIIFANELYSIVPEKFFREENASDYLKFNTKILETDFVAQDLLESFDLVNVYIPYTNINNYFFEKYGEFEYEHHTSILVKEFLKQNSARKEGTKVYLNSHSTGYDLVVIKKGELLLANSFSCETKEDFIYYLLFTTEQLDLDPTSFELILLGDIDKESENYEIAYTYVKNIDFLKTSFGYIFEADNAPPKGYKYFTLLKSL